MAVGARAIKDGVCEAIPMSQSERCSGQANGRAERAIQAVRKQVGTSMRHVNKKLNHDLKPASPFLSWSPRHGGHRLRALREDRVLKCQKPIVAVGEAAICRRPGAQ
eukprot:2530428-Pyramimonas_sp.AAC.1